MPFLKYVDFKNWSVGSHPSVLALQYKHDLSTLLCYKWQDVETPWWELWDLSQRNLEGHSASRRQTEQSKLLDDLFVICGPFTGVVQPFATGTERALFKMVCGGWGVFVWLHNIETGMGQINSRKSRQDEYKQTKIGGKWFAVVFYPYWDTLIKKVRRS